ncbi:MAG TPA: phosphatase PAP2 family protein [Stellaceae bacterium]|jgi:lipid A 4'-phosphatase
MIRAAALLTAALAAVALFALAPGLDLWASGLFYRAGAGGFFLADWGPVRLVYDAVPWVTQAVLLLAVAALAWRRVRGTALLGLDGKRVVFLLAALALGPGILANTVLKDHWGRARPSQVVEFGGTHGFTPPLIPADQCERNCSFVAGHAAMGFYFVAFAFLVRDARRRRQAEAAALGFGALVGLVRIAQGGHFLSDVIWAGILVYGTCWGLYVWIVERDGLEARPIRRLRLAIREAAAHVPGGLRLLAGRTHGRLFLASAGTAAAVAAAMAWVDRPAAVFFKGRDHDLLALFGFITNFGLSEYYLVPSALLFAGLHAAARSERFAFEAKRLRAYAGVPLFLFVAVAASGLTSDIIKIVFGRLRPKLLFVDGAAAYGFGWWSLRADHWSFPSGHSTTIAAVMTALYFLWPRHVLAYAMLALLVASSRVVLAQHYVSDVIMGGFVGVLVTVYVRDVFSRSFIDLSLAKRGLPSPDRSGAAVPPSWRVRLGLPALPPRLRRQRRDGPSYQ